MKLQFCKDNGQLAEMADLWCADRVEKYKSSSIYLPAGGTPIPLYQKWQSVYPQWARSQKFYQIDEVLEGDKKGLFQKFFQEQLPKFESQIFGPEDSGFHQADLGLLGLGENGHVAFHEPHVPADFRFGEVQLAPSTAANLGVPQGTRGISYGLGAFLETKALLLLVSGSDKKKRIFHQFLKNEGSAPANQLQRHSDLTVLALESFRP